VIQPQRSTSRRALAYVISAAAFGALLALSHLLRAVWGIPFDTTTLIILAMIASAWYGGLGPGLLFAVLFEITLDYFAWPPKDPTRFAIVAANRIVLFGSVVLFASLRRAAEQRLRAEERRLAEALIAERAARSEAEAASRMKDEFLSVVSHELRTPLNAILGWAATIGRHEVDEATRRHAVETIERNARAQARVVDDLLSASGLLAGRLRIVPERVSLPALVADVIESSTAAINANSLHVRTRLEDAPDVFADPARLRQVVEQLLSNAIKFTPAGGHIDVDVERRGETVALTVRDDGIGIDRQFLPHVFDKFRQADPSFTREHGGLGLGLAIARELIDLQGGTISARSDGSGRGSVFTVELPAVDVLTRPSAAAAVSR